MKHTLLIWMGAACFLAAEVSVTVDEVSDKRTTGKFFSGLDMKLLLTGPELAAVKGVRVKVTGATDDTGKDLIDTKGNLFADDFEPLKKPFFDSDKKKGGYEVELKLLNPARSSKTLKIAGQVELMSPEGDPASVVSAGVPKTSGKPLDDPALKAAGVTITLKPAKGGSFEYEQKDPKNRVASVEFCGADGKPLKVDNYSSFGGMGTKTFTAHISNPPDEVVARIYLITDKSLVTVPFKFDAVKLP